MTRNHRWLGFELSVLRPIKFNSVAVPFAGQPDLEWYLKFWGKRVFDNDLCQWAWWVSRALVENQEEHLGSEDVEMILDQAYVPRRRFNNPALETMASEMDAWWFDNVWLNIQKIEQEHRRALAYFHALKVGDYLHSFTPETIHLRRPLSEVFASLWRGQRKITGNGQINRSLNLEAQDFIAAAQADLMYVSFPRPEGLAALDATPVGWRERWIRGSADGWRALLGQVEAGGGRLGDRIASKERYLELIGHFLAAATHLPKWVILHVEDGFVSAAELGEVIKTFRPIEVTYAKDFTAVTGGLQAYLLIA